MILIFGSLNIDLVTRVATMPTAGRTVLAPSYERHFGGKGANQAVAASRISGADGVWMAGCAGTDGFGDDVLRNLEANGVDTRLVSRGERPTGCAFITVDQRGENAITVASGANLDADGAVIADAHLTAETVLVLQMEVQASRSIALARRVRAVGGRVVWNLAPVPDDLDRCALGSILANTDYLVVNEHEALDAARLGGGEPWDFRAAAAMLAGEYNLTCIATAGARGASALLPDGTGLHAGCPAIEPIDTTGAGDTFVGAFAAMIAEGQTLDIALKVGCEAASLACCERGAQDGMPERSRISVLHGPA